MRVRPGTRRPSEWTPNAYLLYQHKTRVHILLLFLKEEVPSLTTPPPPLFFTVNPFIWQTIIAQMLPDLFKSEEVLKDKSDHITALP